MKVRLVDWPSCEPAMRASARLLMAHGATEDEVLTALKTDYPGLVAGGPSWRRDAYYVNIITTERMRCERQPDLYDQQIDEPSAYELQVVATVVDLVRVCRRYGIRITLSEVPGDLKISRKLVVGGPLWQEIMHYKAELLRLLALAS